MPGAVAGQGHGGGEQHAADTAAPGRASARPVTTAARLAHPGEPKGFHIRGTANHQPRAREKQGPRHAVQLRALRGKSGRSAPVTRAAEVGEIRRGKLGAPAS